MSHVEIRINTITFLNLRFHSKASGNKNLNILFYFMCLYMYFVLMSSKPSNWPVPALLTRCTSKNLSLVLKIRKSRYNG